jgi:hypothetical protein
MKNDTTSYEETDYTKNKQITLRIWHKYMNAQRKIIPSSYEEFKPKLPHNLPSSNHEVFYILRKVDGIAEVVVLVL